MASNTLPQIGIQTSPIADPAAVVQVDHVRFSLLTSRICRLEYSPTKEFEDHPSQAFWYRNQPVPPHSVKQTEQTIEIETEYMHLVYQNGGKGFTPRNLSILVKSTGVTWHFGDHYRRARNLMGTARTLDGVNGKVDLSPGLNSRAGWALVDDTKTLVFNDHNWLEPRVHDENLDYYFFGYGHDYISSIQDYQKITGETPLIPRFILGNWWSRYWAYTDQELKALMEDFMAHDVPLSICIIDMDWHITKTGNASSGWTGYTWNRELFPDPPAFITWVHSKGLKTALNLHPADGVYPHEEQYHRMAEWMGIDPNTNEPVAFDISDPVFTKGYFELLHHPYEKMGIDFWWIDWQQGAISRMPGLDPLWWINHLHFFDSGRDDQKRPLIFSRWGGLGNHRYPIGFSGDTVISWESLANQPGFTSTAANVAYGWWSHDIGGHMGGIEDDELYTRWIQYGVFSPILRMHCTNNPFHERRPWGRGPAAERAATLALRLRHRLVPYIYTMAWRNHQKGIPLITPVYYTNPEQDGAYDSTGQEYWFGTELLAAPFITPKDEDTGLARQRVWLPDGDWYNFFTGEYFRGKGWQIVYGNLDEIPVFARAGAIVPLDANPKWGCVSNPSTLEVHLFAGASNSFELYEDDSETINYRDGNHAVTAFTLDWRVNQTTFTIPPVVGNASLIPARRSYQLVFHGVINPETVAVTINGKPAQVGYTYNDKLESLTVDGITLAPADQANLSISTGGADLLAKRDRRAEKLGRMLHSFKLDTWLKARINRDYQSLLSGEKSLIEYSGLNDAQASAITHLLNL
jgi:alpha-glucosidase (family GH31 glycosyl hydrolase)